MDAQKVLKQWIIVNLFLLMCGCNSVLPANTPTAIPMEIATRIPTPVPPTATPTPTATSTITPTASPTLTVAPTPNIISAVLRDDFNDGAYDGSFNSNLWDQVLSSGDATCLITQKDGKLIFSQTAELKESRCALGTWKSANWLMTDLQQIKMQYWFESIEGEGDVCFQLVLMSNNTPWWLSWDLCKPKKEGDPKLYEFNVWYPNLVKSSEIEGSGLVWLNIGDVPIARKNFYFFIIRRQNLRDRNNLQMDIDLNGMTFNIVLKSGMSGMYDYYLTVTFPEAAKYTALKDDSFSIWMGLYNAPGTSASVSVDSVYVETGK